MRLNLKKLLSKVLTDLERNQTNKVLWDGTPVYMVAGQTIQLSEPISAQLHGIVLVWSAYSGGAKDYDWHYQFVPKWHISGGYGGKGVFFVGKNGSAVNNTVCNKLVYVSDDSITGNDNNGRSGTGYANSYLVLRKVLGV